MRLSGQALMAGVRGVQSGLAWRQQYDEREAKKAEDAKQQAVRDEATAAWRNRMTPPMIEVDAGVDDDGNPMPKIAQPDPKWDRNGAVVQALGAVADVYARNGDFDRFLATEAKAAPLRAERRTKAIDTAMARYRADKDPIKLAQSVYPHVFDGVDITFAVKRGEDFEFSTSDGQKIAMKPDDLVAQIEYLRDPKAAAEYEAKTRWERIKAGIDRDKQIAVDQGKHKNALGLADAEAEHKRALEGLKNEHARGQIGLRNAGDLATTRERGAQDRLTAKEKPGADAAGKRDAVYDQLHDEIIRGYGDVEIGSLGGKTRVGSPATAQAADYARALMRSDPSMPMDEAKRRAVAEMKKRGLVK